MVLTQPEGTLSDLRTHHGPSHANTEHAHAWDVANGKRAPWCWEPGCGQTLSEVMEKCHGFAVILVIETINHQDVDGLYHPLMVKLGFIVLIAWLTSVSFLILDQGVRFWPRWFIRCRVRMGVQGASKLSRESDGLALAHTVSSNYP